MASIVIEKNISLTDKHTFGLPWKSRFFYELKKEQDIQTLITEMTKLKKPILVLGGGSNLLPTKKYPGLVIHNRLKGKKIIKETKTSVWLEVAAGENWHNLVLWSIRNTMYGLENLSLIPGTVGGAVVQNIGAYDVDIQTYIEHVEAYSLVTGIKKEFSHAQCAFDYRNSIFKSSDKWLVTKVLLKLPRNFKPVLTYKPLRELQELIPHLTAKQVSQEVIKIRRSRLPNWKKIGTAGSFFANPRVSQAQAALLTNMYPDMPVFYNYGSTKATIPAGWLVEHSTLTQANREEFLYHKHALIVVNHNKGKQMSMIKGKRTLAVVERIQKKISQEFGIELRTEVRIF